MTEIQVIPTIIAKDYKEFEERVHRVEPYVDRVHLDIMDGVFVPNKTICGYEELLKIDTHLKFDVHLMISNAEDIMYNWYKTRADRFLIHIETDHGHRGLLEQIRLNERKAGLVLNPETRVDDLNEFAENIDLVQFMTVKPGSYGSPFEESVLLKISDFHMSHPDIPIIVDGSIHGQTAARAVLAGASILAIGSHIFEEDRDIGEAIAEIRQLVTKL